MASIGLTKDTYQLLMNVAGNDHGRTSAFVWELCLGYYRAQLAAAPRPGRTWHEVYAPYGVGPVPAPGRTDRALPERTWNAADTVTVALAPYAADLLLDMVGDDQGPESVDGFVWDLCLAYYRTDLIASPRPECPDEVLEVAIHLSYIQGLVTDFQGVAVVATAHAPACDRLSTAVGCEVETVTCADFAAVLQAKAEAGAEAQRTGSDVPIDVQARTATCRCLDGTPVSAPRSYPDQPDDLIYLVGTELAERYEDLFGSWHFGTHRVETRNGVGAVKSIRWMHLSPEETCTHRAEHASWDDCEDVRRDLTFECDRGCHEGCDWVLYPQYGRARLAVHGNDIDLGPLEEDHTAELTDHLLPQLRL
jgi:hypothetical protein